MSHPFDTNQRCYELLRKKSIPLSNDILYSWGIDDRYGDYALHVYVKENHPDLWTEILPEMVKWKLRSWSL